MHSLRIVFFTLPLYFSHVLSPFGIVFWDTYSFERQKVYFLLFFLFYVFVEWLFRFPHSIRNTIHKYGYICSILLCIPIISVIFFWKIFDQNFFFGSYEKNHWYLFFVSIIGYAIILISSPKEHLEKYLYWSIISACIVALMAIWEQWWGYFDIYHRSEMPSMYRWRSSSTLWNPNYLAGYLLLFIPILISGIQGKDYYPRIIKIIAIWILLWWVAMTWSYIAWWLVSILWLGYIFYVLNRYLHIHTFLVSTIFILCISTILYILFLDNMKALSFESRFVLMSESLRALTMNPLGIIVWFGPDSILSYFSENRSQWVELYFPSRMNIDSSHNLYIDILFQYGIFPLFLLVYSLPKKISKDAIPLIHSIVLLGIYLAFNVFVVTHILLFLLLLTLLSKNICHKKSPIQ